MSPIFSRDTNRVRRITKIGKHGLYFDAICVVRPVLLNWPTEVGVKVHLLGLASLNYLFSSILVKSGHWVLFHLSFPGRSHGRALRYHFFRYRFTILIPSSTEISIPILYWYYTGPIISILIRYRYFRGLKILMLIRYRYFMKMVWYQKNMNFGLF